MQTAQRKVHHAPRTASRTTPRASTRTMPRNVSRTVTAPRKAPVASPRKTPTKKRVVKMDGNVAYINNGFAKKKVKQTAAAAKKEAKQKRSGLASTLFVLFLAFCAMALLISRYAAVCSIGSDNNQLENKIKTVQTKIEELSLDMELRDNLENISNYAKQDLGMMYPEQEQKIYIDMGG